MMQIFRDGTLTIESLDGNKLYLDSTTQFRMCMYTILTNRIYENNESQDIVP